jgi:hypothetical protein
MTSPATSSRAGGVTHWPSRFTLCAALAHGAIDKSEGSIARSMRDPCAICPFGIAQGWRTADKMVPLSIVNLFAIECAAGQSAERAARAERIALLNPKGFALIKCVYCEIIRANPRSYWGVAA